MEAGNRCFDQRVPEEINRKIVDHLSDINLVLTEHARRYLIAEGVRPETIIKTGSCMQEVLSYYKKSISDSDVLKRLNLNEKDYFVLSAHREENIDSEENFKNLLETLNHMSEQYNMRIIFSSHPRTTKRLNECKNVQLNPLVEVMKPLGFSDYVKLQLESFCVVSDSGTITEESSILGFPAVTIRNAHERPEGMDEGTLIMSGLKKNRVIQSIDIVTQQFKKYGKPRSVGDYNGEKVSAKMVRIIQSYTDYINRVVWRRQ